MVVLKRMIRVCNLVIDQKEKNMEKKQRAEMVLVLSFLLVLVCCGSVLANPNPYELSSGSLSATGVCRHFSTEGIQYYYQANIRSREADLLRNPLVVTANSGLKVDSMEVVTATDRTRYQCTQANSVSGTAFYDFSCNSIPANSAVTGVYFYVTSPTDSYIDTPFTITVHDINTDHDVIVASGKAAYPAYPCSTNQENRDWTFAADSSPVVNTTHDGLCTAKNAATKNPGDGDSVVRFVENTSAPFKIVNTITGADLDNNRFFLNIDPVPQSYQFNVTLNFKDYNGTTFQCSGSYPEGSTDPRLPLTCNFSSPSYPLTLVDGTLSDFKTSQQDLWGNETYPANTNFDFKFYYENETGTLGYENSMFHFERTLNIEFREDCEADITHYYPSGVAKTYWNSCGGGAQMFEVDLSGTPDGYVPVPVNYVDCSSGAYAEGYCTSMSAFYGQSIPAAAPSGNTNYHFKTSKCTDATCSVTSDTGSYIQYMTFSNSDQQYQTVKRSGGSGGTISTFPAKAYGTGYHPFGIRSIQFRATEPGTYEIKGFVPYANKSYQTDYYAVKFYVTIPRSTSIAGCSTDATNGKYISYWNDCLDPDETQLIPFESLTDETRGFIRNFSDKGIYYKYDSEHSTMPQALEMAKLSCVFSKNGDGSDYKNGSCSKDSIYVPAHTTITIKGGKFYLQKYPGKLGGSQLFTIAYRREDTGSQMDLNIEVGVEECKNASIPNTGISLRTPLTARAKNETSFVFTGNSLQIPAIGLGMETPIPIVHVYYENNDSTLGWDLSTLGNYVGELEGSTYLPYAGNSTLTGHYYSQGVFKNLEGLNMGDEIIVYGNDGFKYIYHVVERFIAQPADVYSMFQPVGERSLTLVTCENYNLVTDEYERRTIVRAVIDSVTGYEM